MEALRRNTVPIALGAFLIGFLIGFVITQSLIAAFFIAWAVYGGTALSIASSEPKREHDDSINGEHPTN